ncbi:MAG: glycosyltransferase family 4 protein [Actinobacteria bacterium]|nr:glycosyltransferase family 4 protein [Actinomycetota bacterium]
MKILHITKKYPDIMGGDSTVVESLEKYQKKKGHQVYILTSNCDEIKKSPQVTKYALKIDALYLDRINLNRIISLFILLFYSFFYLKKIKPDIVHSHSPELGFILSFACKLYGIPVINTCHGVTFSDKNYSFIKRKLEEFFLKYGYFKKIITVNASSLKDFKKSNINNVDYLPNGVDLDEFQKKRHKINKKVIFLFVGRVEADKGLSYLIDAADRLKRIEKNFELLLVGTGIDQNFFQDLVNELNLSDYIKFLGKKNKDELMACYYNADVFILPSLHEGFPMTILEAWAAELPVIVTDVGGIRTICINKENALIIPPKNPEKISAAMTELIKDKELRRKLGKNGRSLVEEKYNWGKIIKDVDKIYEDVLCNSIKK